MLRPRLIVLSAATVGLLVAGEAFAQTAGDLRPTIWNAEDEIAGDDTDAVGEEEVIPPPSLEVPRTTLEVNPEELPPPAPKLRQTIEDDPYAPFGWRFGGLTAFFGVGAGANFTDNVEQSETDRKSDVGLLIAPKFSIESDWSRHKFTAQGNGQFVRYAHESDYDTQEGEGRADLRLEVRRTTALDLAAFYILTQDTASAVDVPDDAIGTRNEEFYGGSVALEQIIGDFTTRFKSGFSREYYGDVTLPDDVVDTSTDQNYYELGFSWRTTYAPTPNLRPFVELAYLPRYRDKEKDRNGLSRSSMAMPQRSAWASTLPRSGRVNSGCSICCATMTIRRSIRLKSFGPIGRITWRPSELTNVALSAATYLDEATDPGLERHTQLVGRPRPDSHELRENIKLLAGVGVELPRYPRNRCGRRHIDANPGSPGRSRGGSPGRRRMNLRGLTVI